MSDDDKKIRLNLRGDAPVSPPPDEDLQGALFSSYSAPVAPSEPAADSGRLSTHSRGLSDRPAPSLRTKEPGAVGSVLRDRGKRTKPDIDDVWEDLKSRQISDNADGEHMLANREIGEVIDRVGAVMGGASKRLKKAYSQAATPQPGSTGNQKRKKKPQLKLGANPGPQLSLQSRLTKKPVQPVAEPAVRRYMKQAAGFAGKMLRGRRRTIGAVALGALLLFVALPMVRGGDSSSPSSSNEQALGASVTSEQIASDQQASGSAPEVVTSTEFELLYPAGKSDDSLELVKVSPPNNAPVYAYVDVVESAEVRLSQQEIPPEFKGVEDVKLAEIAKDFQATDILQIDDLVVYYGFTERFGGVQSLVFIKDGVMTFMSSSKKLSDDTWAGYIVSLSK